FMLNLASILYSVIGSSLAGTFVIAALVTGYDTLWPILIAAVAGGVLAIPLTYFITRAMTGK
ncbi:MAG: CTP synthetase, partial [Octadecabacter sp.]